MKLIFATGNKGKLREAQEILGQGFTLVTPAAMGITEEIPETGSTLEENSLQKAEYLSGRAKDVPGCFADDTGLEVEALGGAPGVYTARYAGGDGHEFAIAHRRTVEFHRQGPQQAVAEINDFRILTI